MQPIAPAYTTWLNLRTTWLTWLNLRTYLRENGALLLQMGDPLVSSYSSCIRGYKGDHTSYTVSNMASKWSLPTPTMASYSHCSERQQHCLSLSGALVES
jgi:hypothetical protein